MKALLDAIYPPMCGLCGALTPLAICESCRGEFDPNEELIISPPPLDYTVAAYRYEGRVSQAIQRLKYERITSLAAPMADDIAECAERNALQPDTIVPVPIHRRRLCERGFNQCDLLVAKLPQNLLNKESLLRIRATLPQARLTLEERSTNLAGAFSASSEVFGLHVLLVDDVTTSGHTARECAKALKDAGASRVGLLAYATGGDYEHLINVP